MIGTMDTLVDYITGLPVADMGAVANRQQVARYLVTTGQIPKSAISVADPLTFEVDGVRHASYVDLAVRVDGRCVLVLKVAAGSIGSGEREAIAMARLADADQIIPLAAVSDGRDAVVLDAVSGRRIGEGLGALPDWAALTAVADQPRQTLPIDRLRRERLVYRTYAAANVHILRS